MKIISSFTFQEYVRKESASKGACKKERDRLFAGDRTSGSSFKLKEGDLDWI